jgi:hypothetical protein
VPACRATLSWFGPSPRAFSHHAAASAAHHLREVRGDLRAELGADVASRLAGDLRAADDLGQAGQG